MLSQYRRISTEVFSYKYCSTIVLVLQYRIYVTESVLGMNRYKKKEGCLTTSNLSLTLNLIP